MNEEKLVLAGRYAVGKALGHGGMADVYLAEDRRLHRTVAVKILRTELARDTNFQERFRREAQSAAGLNHPSIVAVYDTGEETSRDFTGNELTIPYIVMEYVHGRTLREFIDPEAGMPVQRASQIMAALLSALEYSHQAGIVHRDIKPGNIMITDDGDVKVMDFGIARALSDATGMTQTQAVMGTAQYLSPEQARGQLVDARSDIYSAACVYYEMLTGRPPFTGDSPVSIAYQHVRETPVAPSTFNARINEDLDAVILTGLAKDREARYASAAAFARDIAAVMSGRSPELGEGDPQPRDDAEATTVLGAVDADRTEFLPATAAAAGAASAGRHAARPTGTLGTAPAAPVVPAPAEEEKPKKPVWLYILLGIAALAVLGAALFFLWPRDSAPATVAVPDVVNMTQEQARTTLEGEGLTPQFTPAPSTDVEADHVISTDPGAGSQVAQGSTVAVSVSSGPADSQIPDLTGMQRSAAEAALAEHGLTLAVGETVDSKEAAGTVISQNPAPGGTGKAGDTITVTLASGSNEIPDLSGLSREEAQKALDDAGFKATFREQEDPAATAGTVIGQDPAGGSGKVGGSVTVTLAKSPGQVALDNVVGMAEAEANATLTGAGFGANPTREASDTVAAGRVIRTDPEGGSLVDPKITVTIVVSSGPATPTPASTTPAPSTTAPAPTTTPAPSDPAGGDGDDQG